MSASLAYGQQDTLYLKNKFNEDGNVVFKDTTWMRAPLYYVDTMHGSPVTGIIIEKHRNGKRITHAQNGLTMKQIGHMKKSMFYLFYDSNTQNYISIKYWKNDHKFEVLCINDNKFPHGANFKSLKNGEIRKTVSKEEETVTNDFMTKTLIETLPQYEVDLRQIFSKIE